MKVFQAMDGFLWADVTPMAEDIWYNGGIFELYAIHEDGSEHLIESESDLVKAIKYKNIIAIELCFLTEITLLN